MAPFNPEQYSLNEKLSGLSIGDISDKDRKIISTLMGKYHNDVQRKKLAYTYYNMLENNGSKMSNDAYNDSQEQKPGFPTNSSLPENDPMTKIIQKMNRRQLQLDNLITTRQAKQKNLKKLHKDKLERIQSNRKAFENDVEEWKSDLRDYSNLIEKKCELKCKQFYLHRSNLISNKRQAKERKLTAALDKLGQEERLAKGIVLESVLSKHMKSNNIKADKQKRLAMSRINSEISKRLRENIRELHGDGNFSDS